MGPETDRESWNEDMYKDGEGLLPVEIGELAGDVQHDMEVHLIQPDFDHPAISFFRPFPGKLTDVVIYQYLESVVNEEDPDVRVLSRYGVPEAFPAMVEKSFGQGNVLCWTTTLNHDWNHIMKTGSFLVLAHETMRYLSSRSNNLQNIQVGEYLQAALPIKDLAKEFRLKSDDDDFVSLFPGQIETEDTHFILQYPATTEEDEEMKNAAAPEEGSEEAKAELLELPDPGVRTLGHYELIRPASNEGDDIEDRLMMYFAVNVDPVEGDLRKISKEEISSLYPGFKFRLIDTISGQEDGEIQIKAPTSELWRYLVYAVLALLMVESFLAWRFGSARG
jgi:hypothetical protein